MRLKNRWVVAALGLLGLLAHSAPAVAQSRSNVPEIYPLSKVKRGQKGYGLTTNAGTKPMRFEFEVLGVSKNFIPKMDIILVKSDDPKMQHTGFWQGMSGSPLFIDGKLACAFAYSWRFTRSPVGGCTPIKYMRDDAATPRRHLDEASARSGAVETRARRRAARRHHVGAFMGSTQEWKQMSADGGALTALYSRATPNKPWLMSGPMPVRAKPDDAGTGASMVPQAVPLAMAGLTKDAFDQARVLFDGFPVQPMRAGGTGNANEGPTELTLGAPMGVQLIRGDIAGTGTCTVSWVEGDKVLACGHPMFGAGEFYAPITASEVHLVVPSDLSSHVVASPMRELGALVQDRQSMIAGDTNLSTAMVPVDVSIESKTGNRTVKQELHAEVINNRYFTAPFAGLTVMNAISRYVPDRDHVTALMESTVWIKGKKPLHFVDYLYASDGAGNVLTGARGLRVLMPLLSNPFEPVTIERVEVKATIDFEPNFGEIEGIRLPSAKLTPGKRNAVQIELSTYDGKRWTETVPFDVPSELAGSIVKLKVTAGDSAGVDAAPPQNLDELLDVFRQLLPGNTFAVVLYTAEPGAAIDGKLIRDLPPSAADRFKMETRNDRAADYHAASRSTFPTRRVIDGNATILVRVADK